MKKDCSGMEENLKLALQAVTDEYCGKVFECPGIYFVVTNGKVLEIPDDSGYGPKGAWFPNIITGLTKDQCDYIKTLMNKFDVSEDFFWEFVRYCDNIDDLVESLNDYLAEPGNDKDKKLIQNLYNKVVDDSKHESFPFNRAEEVIWKFNRYGLKEDALYYKWDGMYIEFYENICDVGEQRGYYDDMSDEEWFHILTHLDAHIVQPN